jgi:DNA-binding NarL/FixJ family response regulator
MKTDSMVAHKFLVLCRRSLLAQGMVSLLAAEPRVEVTTADLEMEDAEERFREVRPEVVVLDLRDGGEMERLVGHFLRQNPLPKVVCLDSCTGATSILRGKTWVPASMSELLATLEKDSEEEEKGG